MFSIGIGLGLAKYDNFSAFAGDVIDGDVENVIVNGVIFERDASGTVIQDDGTKWSLAMPAFVDDRAAAVAFASEITANSGNAAVGDLLCWSDATCEFDGSSTTFSDMPGWKPIGAFVRPVWWGGTYDGVADDTAAVTACHAFANAVGVPVTYAGLSVVSIEADDAIVINTDVDFAGCLIKARNGIIGTPSASTTTYMFNVFDADTAVVTGTATGLTSANLEDGSLTPTADFFAGMGLCQIQGNAGTPFSLPDRDKTGSMHYIQTLAITRAGRATHPLPVDISGYTSLDYTYREMPARGRLTIKNVALDPSTFNSAVIFHVQRNNVEINGMQIIPTGTDDDTFNRIIRGQHVAYLDVCNIMATAQTEGGNGGGTYLLSFHDCAEVTIDNVHALNGWGMMGSFDISGFRVTRSTINRVDAHSGMFYTTVDGCTFQDIGLVYSWGGGFIRVTNCTLIECPAIRTRDDYGGFFFGSLYVDGIQLQGNTFAQTIVGIGDDTPIGVDGFTLPAAYSIHVSNVQRDWTGGGTNREIRPLDLFVDGTLTTGDVQAPQSITISNIHCGGNWRMRMNVDMENMIDGPQNDDTIIMISDCTPSRTVADEESMFYVPANTIAGAGANGRLVMSNVRNASINTTETTRLSHQLFNCTITFAKTANNVRLQIDGGALVDPQLHGAETESPLGGTPTTNDDYLSLRNVHVEHTDWDLSNVYASIGTEIRSGRNPTLPATATKLTMYTGFQVAGF